MSAAMRYSLTSRLASKARAEAEALAAEGRQQTGAAAQHPAAPPVALGGARCS